MNPRYIILLILFVIPLSAVAIAQEIQPASDWEVIGDIGDGIEFQKFRLAGPVNVFVARMDRDNPNAIIDSSIAQGRLSGGLETVTGMAARYDQAINNWNVGSTPPVIPTWGARNDVIVAINGYYFDYGTGIPQRGQVQAGWYAKRYDDDANSSGFIWKMDRDAFIGGCITHEPEKQIIYIAGGDQYTYELDGLNRSRGDDEMILYTTQYDSDTNTENQTNSIEILIEMEVQTFISVAKEMPGGKIIEIRDKKGSTPIPWNHVVLSAHGTAAADLKAKVNAGQINIGDDVAIAQKVKDCIVVEKDRWVYAYAGVGGHWRFLRDGVVFPYDGDTQAIVREPRTAIAYNQDYIFFIVADGRDPGISIGMTVAEMAAFTKNTLNATDAIMQDGGGSSTMAIWNYAGNGTFDVVNNTFCNHAGCEAHIYLPMILNASNSAGSDQIAKPDNQVIEWDAETQILQRLVANGMMMVVVEPLAQSSTFTPGDYVATTTETSLRLGPGTNYGVLSSLSSGAAGDVLQNTKGLDGVLAKGTYWWQVDIGNATGWVAEDFLVTELKSAPADWREDANPLR